MIGSYQYENLMFRDYEAEKDSGIIYYDLVTFKEKYQYTNTKHI